MAAEGKVPFWIHQTCEYLVGLLILFEGARLKHPAVPLVAGVAVLILAATGDGPMSAFRRVPRAVHRIMDLVVAGAALVAALVFRTTLGSSGISLLVIIAGVLALMAWRTDYRPRQPRRTLKDRLPKVDAEDVGRKAGRAVGTAAIAGKRWWQGRKT
jgi:hypothetical protein